MKGVLGAALAAGVIGVVPFGGPTGTPVTTTSPAVSLTSVGGSLLAPVGSARVIGVVGMMSGSGGITVSINASGLQPYSKNQVRVSAGACSVMVRPASYTLPPLMANADGDAAAVDTLNVSTMPAAGFSFSIVTANGTTNQACGNLHHPTYAVKLTPMKSSVNAVAMMTEPAPVLGPTVAQTMGTEVIVIATGLIPGVANPEHIHALRCGQPSGILLPLNDLVADAQGRAIAGTGIPGFVPYKNKNLSLHIHNPATPAFSMIACGNV